MDNLLDKWGLTNSEKAQYVQELVCAYANYVSFSKFKQGAMMRIVVENSHENDAVECGKIICEQFPEMLEDKALNEIIVFEKTGSPSTVFVDGIGVISPTTVRYILHTAIIKKHIGSLNGLSIAEIGGGYGGLATVICSYFEIKGYYQMFDLPEAMNFQQKYFSRSLPASPEIIKNNLNNEVCPIDLIIASCSWSELSYELKLEYILTVISKAKYGFFIINWNYEENLQMLRDYLRDHTFEAVENGYIIMKPKSF